MPGNEIKHIMGIVNAEEQGVKAIMMKSKKDSNSRLDLDKVKYSASMM